MEMEARQYEYSPASLRRRPTLACEPCRKRKIRCDRKRPCAHCQRSHHTCVFLDLPSPAAPRQNASGVSLRIDQGLADASTRTGAGSSAEPLTPSDATRRSPPRATWIISTIGNALVDNDTPGESLSIDEGPQSYDEREAHPPAGGISADRSRHTGLLGLKNISRPVRRIMVKNRKLGQSHWANAALANIEELHAFDQDMRTKGECWKLLQDCKSLSSHIKLQRKQKVQIPREHSEFGRWIPPRQIADSLLDAYLRTFETVYRILHVPSLKDEYENFWERAETRRLEFVIMLQLCLAIGACFYDDTFSLRKEATQWVYEARAWLLLSEKSQSTIWGLQIMCLLHIARQTCGIEASASWISIGSLVNAAMLMGVHLDPYSLPRMSILEAEMSRRLWATILELVLESSSTAGTAPLISVEDFDCQPPSNLDDHHLIAADCAESAPQPLPPDVRTGVSTQIALTRSFALRLSILKLANGAKTGGVTLAKSTELSSQLITAIRELRQHLQRIGLGSSSSFQSCMCDMIMQDYLLTLHVPFVPLIPSNPAFIPSQRQCVDIATRLSYSILDPISVSATVPEGAALLAAAMRGLDRCEDFMRLHIGGSGWIKSVRAQCTKLLAVELATCAREAKASAFVEPAPPAERATTASAGMWDGSRAFGASIRGPELWVLLRGWIGLVERRLSRGEAGIKEYVVPHLMMAHAEGIMSTAPDEDIMRQRCLDAMRLCKERLYETARTETPDWESSQQVDTHSTDTGSDQGFFWWVETSDLDAHNVFEIDFN
ncbi:hypothetical protein BX600DRAFT_467509 [Xylariales sp. PMI_506]|nr:hypothetical protein BX600DRAFT_467509 [Xylariales sp. PMI_506]